MDPIVTLIAACTAFVGGHFAMSHPLREPMVRRLGEQGFQGVYSIIVLAAFVWMYFAFKAAPTATPFWSGFDDISWIIGSALTLVAMMLLAGSFSGNPALPAPGAGKAARAEPAGVFRVTRHPMMWSFALWAIAHIIASPTARTLILASAILILALIGSRMQDRKKQVLMGEDWAIWSSKTSYWPRWSQLFSTGLLPWIVGIALWLGFSWLHQPMGGWDAGVWRWL